MHLILLAPAPAASPLATWKDGPLKFAYSPRRGESVQGLWLNTGSGSQQVRGRQRDEIFKKARPYLPHSRSIICIVMQKKKEEEKEERGKEMRERGGELEWSLSKGNWCGILEITISSLVWAPTWFLMTMPGISDKNRSDLKHNWGFTQALL